MCRGHLSSCGRVLFLNVMGALLSGSDVQRCSLIVVMSWRLLSSHGRWPPLYLWYEGLLSSGSGEPLSNCSMWVSSSLVAMFIGATLVVVGICCLVVGGSSLVVEGSSQVEVGGYSVVVEVGSSQVAAGGSSHVLVQAPLELWRRIPR